MKILKRIVYKIKKTNNREIKKEGYNFRTGNYEKLIYKIE